MKRIVLSLIIGLSVLSATSADQIVKTGIIDLAMLNQGLKDAQTEHMESLKVAIQKDIDRMKEEIRLLGEQRTDAANKGDTARVQSLDADILAKKTAFTEFGKKKQEELNAAGELLRTEVTLQKFLKSRMDDFARSKGISILLSKSNSVVLFFMPEVDLTAELIDKLRVEMGLQPLHPPVN